MSDSPLVAPRTAAAQPAPGSTRVLQRSYQIDDPPAALQVNQEFDRVYEALNKIAVAAAQVQNLPTDGTATNIQICSAINALLAAVR